MKSRIAVLLLAFVFLAALALAPYMSSAQGGVTGFANVRVTNFYRAQPRTALTVAANGQINATGSYQRIRAAAAVGTAGTNVVLEPAGSILTLVNVGPGTITITETGVFTSAGNIVLGSGDTTTLYSDGLGWTQVSGSNN